jgi:hypothetical protein
MNKQFFVTHSGVRVYPDDLSNLKVSLDDISHHLANIRRFGGALDFHQYYSVGQHSIIMANYALKHYGKDIARACLLHDATEAYIGDVVSPLKAVLKEYQLLEDELCATIYNRYGISADIETAVAVKTIDKRILLDEVKEFIPAQLDLFKSIYIGLEPLGVEIDGTLEPQIVKDAFLCLADYLNIRDN